MSFRFFFFKPLLSLPALIIGGPSLNRVTFYIPSLGDGVSGLACMQFVHLCFILFFAHSKREIHAVVSCVGTRRGVCVYLRARAAARAGVP